MFRTLNMGFMDLECPVQYIRRLCAYMIHPPSGIIVYCKYILYEVISSSVLSHNDKVKAFPSKAHY